MVPVDELDFDVDEVTEGEDEEVLEVLDVLELPEGVVDGVGFCVLLGIVVPWDELGEGPSVVVLRLVVGSEVGCEVGWEVGTEVGSEVGGDVGSDEVEFVSARFASCNSEVASAASTR